MTEDAEAERTEETETEMTEDTGQHNRGDEMKRLADPAW